MKNIKKILIFATFTLLSLSAYANQRVESIGYRNLSNNHFFEVNYKDGKKPDAKLEFKPNVIQLSLPNTIVWPKQEKRVRPEGANFDVSILAYQFTKDSVRFRIVFPDNLTVDQSKVSLRETGKGYRIIWKNDQAVSKGNAKPSSYDESYLNKLLNEKPKADKVAKVENKTIQLLEKSLKEDKVNSALAATSKEGESGNNLNDYLFKFVMIVLVMAGMLVVALHLMRKGVLKKGKLNFLRNTNQIEQISSTHLSPKRSLHLVKVAGQVFFIGATDNGISLISEINSPGNVLKEAEKILSGDNFESNLQDVEARPEAESVQVKIKEDITTSSKDGLEEKKSEFVNQLKQRVKNLKSLQ